MITIITAIVSLGIGFGLGRVKNAAKLAAVRAELHDLRQSMVAAIRSRV
jgi:hypothetical protein